MQTESIRIQEHRGDKHEPASPLHSLRHKGQTESGASHSGILQ